MATSTVDRRGFLQRVAIAAGGTALWPFADVVAGPAQAAMGFQSSGPSPTCGTARSGCTCPRLPVPLVPRHRRAAGRPRRRHRPARPPRRHGRVPRPRRQRRAGPQPRGQRTRRPRVRRRRRRTTPMARGGTTTIEVTPHGEVARGVHQPERHADELLRRADAVGQLDHLRGDGQRARRRARLHRCVQRRRCSKRARLHLRGARPAAQSNRAADHVGRAVRPRGGRLRPARRASST